MLRKIDAHVHLVGDGSAGSGCWFSMPTLWKKTLARLMVEGIGLDGSVLKTGLDEAYVGELRRQVDDSELDAVVLLAQDWPHDERGEARKERASFYVPNEYLWRVCEESEGRFVPAVSIHPYRRDALAELEKWISRGVRVLKLLPNCHNVDGNAKRTREFWEMMAAGKMIFLAHTGGEYTVPVWNRAYESPEVLRQPLECGVTCIAAHAASSSLPIFGKNFTPLLREMMREYPHLYADHSAMATLNRCDSVRELLEDELALERVIHGSDFPVPVGGFGPWSRRLISREDWAESRREKNVLQRDVALKRAMGFPEETLTRMSRLLDF